MTPLQFKPLPPLIHRADLVACGIPDDAVDTLRHAVRDGQPVPAGKIGAIRGLARPRKGQRQRKGQGYWLYRKADLARILGPDYQERNF